MTRRVGQLPKEDRPTLGKRANQIKQGLTVAYQERAAAIRTIEMKRQIASGTGVEAMRTQPTRAVATIKSLLEEDLPQDRLRGRFAGGEVGRCQTRS